MTYIHLSQETHLEEERGMRVSLHHSRDPQCTLVNLASFCFPCAVARLLSHANQQKETVPLKVTIWMGSVGEVTAVGHEDTIVKDEETLILFLSIILLTL